MKGERGETAAVPSPGGHAPRLLHRWAMLLVGLTWPLIWVGGMVTTYDAGMAVPDWPETYGYNMFRYPWQSWLFGPFDLFLEHGHRLHASLVGLLAIALVGIAWWVESRRWVVALTGVFLLGVIFQGVLGGVRVIEDARTLALLHGCVGPLVLVMCVAIAGVTGRWWRRAWIAQAAVPSRAVLRLAAFVTGGTYVQLVLGANLRHLDVTDTVAGFRHLALAHVSLALLLALLAAVLAWRIGRCGDLTLSTPAGVLVGLLVLQILLGVGTWVANYAWPWGLERLPGMADYRIQAKGLGESLVVTAHVATGALILAIAGLVWLRVRRVRWLAGTVGRNEASVAKG